MGQHDGSHVFSNRGFERRGRHGAHAMAAAEQRGQALGHVAVGGEIAGLGENRGAPRPQLERGGEYLKQAHAGRVADDGFARRRADQRADLVADAGGQVEPAVGAPTADQVDAPFLLHHPAHAPGHGLGHRA
jgi:hypothetical protein